MGMIQSMYAGRDAAAERRLAESQADLAAQQARQRIEMGNAELQQSQIAQQEAQKERERQRRLNISTGLIRGIEIAKRTGNKAALQGYWAEVQPYLQQQLGDKAQLAPEWQDDYEAQVYRMHASLGGEVPQFAQPQQASSDFLRAIQIIEDPRASPQMKEAAMIQLGQKPRAIETRPAPRIVQGIDPNTGQPTFEVVDLGAGQAPTVRPAATTKEAETNEGERKNAASLMVMRNAEKIFEDAGGQMSEAGYYTSQIPFGQYLTPTIDQKARAAMVEWYREKLRNESGAVIGESEAFEESKRYFPVPGDRPETIEQKKEARRVAMEGLEIKAGRAAPKAQEQKKRLRYNPQTGRLE